MAADPLGGEWRQDFSCEDNVKTFPRLVLIDYDEAFYRKWVRSDFAWGPNRDTATDGGIDMGTGYRFTFKIVGDRLTIVLHRDPFDPWNGVPFGVAPFYRVS